MMYLKGPTSGARRFRCKIHRSYFHHHASADAISCFQRSDTEVINVSTRACGRGALVVNEGTGKLRVWGLRDRVGVFPDEDGGSGIDLEAFDALNDPNPKRVDVEVKKMSTESEFDMILDQGSAVVFDGVEQLRGGQYMIANGATSITVRNFTLRYWRDDAGFNRPLQMGTGCSATFEDGLFIADGTMFYENTKVFFPSVGDWYLPLRLTDTTAITYLRCTWASNNLPAGTNTLRCARNRVADTAGLTLTLDNITIPDGFQQACFILNGGTVRHRAVNHQGFPGAAINTIATGASSYVAL